eukprot:6477865-Pyramimonas_sp.AAC.1
MAFLGHSLDLLGASSRLGLNTLFEMPSLVESLGLAGVSFVLGRGMVLFARSSDLEGAYSRLGHHSMAPNWHEKVSRYSAAVLLPTSRPIEPLLLM